MKKIFIDGSAGTTGLRIHDRLASRSDIALIKLTEDMRKDLGARREAINSADVAFLCLPDDAAREAVGLVENDNTVIIDTSTAHRTLEGWAYGFPELSPKHMEAVKTSKRIAVPGCHAGGFIALVYPLVEAGILPTDTLMSAYSLTGYSGGGKKMIADYTAEGRAEKLHAPQQYGLSQQHKHLKEMKAKTGLDNFPVFCPVVCDFYSGMQVTVPLFASQIKGSMADVVEIYKAKYQGPMVTYEEVAEGGFLSSVNQQYKDTMKVGVYGEGERMILTATYDNLGKGASGAAVECLNISLGEKITLGLEI